MKPRIGLIVEDIRFELFLRPLVACLARQAGTPVLLGPSLRLGGCRPRCLKKHYEQVKESCDLIVLGADSKSAGKALSHRRKERRLRAHLAEDPRLVIAVAEPSIEAWILCDPAAFAQGLTAGTGVVFRLPAEWPAPRTEQEAKEALGRVVVEGYGAPLSYGGFGYAPEIVQGLDFEKCPSESLGSFARDLVGRLRSAGCP